MLILYIILYYYTRFLQCYIRKISASRWFFSKTKTGFNVRMRAKRSRAAYTICSRPASRPTSGTWTNRQPVGSCRVQFETTTLRRLYVGTTMFLFLAIVFVCVRASPTGAQTEIDLDDVRTIKNQLNLLMENRQRDYQQMEKSLRESIKGSADFESLKEEIQLLRWMFPLSQLNCV